MNIDKVKIGSRILRSGSRRKIFNLFQNIYSVCAEPIKPSNSPLIIQVEPTTYCNLECVMCASPGLKRKRNHLSKDRFRKLLDEFEYVEKINLVGIGEPLLNPDLTDLVKMAKTRGIIIGIASNGVLLNDEIVKKLLDSGINWINISIDGANSKTYEKIRGSDDFYRVLKNAENLQRLLGNYKRVESAIWFTIQKENLNELPRMIPLVKSIGYRKLCSQTTHTWGHAEMVEKKGYMLNGCKEELLNAIAKTNELSKQENVSYYSLNVPNDSGIRSCKWPWRSCYVSVEGYVTPCCMNGSDPGVINFGSIYDHSFEQIWNSSKYLNFRKQLKSKKPPKICVNCPSF